MAKKLIPIIESIPHKTYVEVFGGAGHLLFGKKPSKIDVYNDLHSGLVNLFNVIREQPEEFQQLLTLTPYSRETFNESKHWETIEEPIEKAYWFYIRLMQSFSNSFSSWSYTITSSRRGMANSVSRWLGNVDKNLPAAIERLRGLQIENLDFEELILKYDKPTTLFYLDPPYLPQTRGAKKVYKHEMSYENHERLVNVLKEIKGKAVLSGYDNDLYGQLGWKKHLLGKYAVSASKKATKDKNEEWIWMKI